MTRWWWPGVFWGNSATVKWRPEDKENKVWTPEVGPGHGDPVENGQGFGILTQLIFTYWLSVVQCKIFLFYFSWILSSCLLRNPMFRGSPMAPRFWKSWRVRLKNGRYRDKFLWDAQCCAKQIMYWTQVSLTPELLPVCGDWLVEAIFHVPRSGSHLPHGVS